jgi:hypothetical protein
MYTWEQLTRKLISMLDLVLMNHKRRCIVKDGKVYMRNGSLFGESKDHMPNAKEK